MKIAEPVVMQGVIRREGKAPTTDSASGLILKPIVCSVCGYVELYNEKTVMAPDTRR